MATRLFSVVVPQEKVMASNVGLCTLVLVHGRELDEVSYYKSVSLTQRSKTVAFLIVAIGNASSTSGYSVVFLQVPGRPVTSRQVLVTMIPDLLDSSLVASPLLTALLKRLKLWNLNSILNRFVPVKTSLNG